jgi:hypothetical protein
MVDYPQTRTPQWWVLHTIDSHGLTGQPIGIYRIVSPSGYPEQVWRGDLSTPSKLSHAQVGNVRLTVFEHKYSWRELIQRSTFGAFELALDLKLPSKNSPYWTPRIIRNLGSSRLALINKCQTYVGEPAALIDRLHAGNADRLAPGVGDLDSDEALVLIVADDDANLIGELALDLGLPIGAVGLVFCFGLLSGPPCDSDRNQR